MTTILEKTTGLVAFVRYRARRSQYVAEHPREFNIDAAGLAIAGDSVGGNMTAVVSLLAKSARVRRSWPRFCSIRSPTPAWMTARTNLRQRAVADEAGDGLVWNAYLPDATTVRT
jgi:acetyl esterase/lipase